MDFILEQIRRAEAHAAGGQLLGSGPNQIPNPVLPLGLRTVDGRHNNLIAGQESFGAADRLFPRLLDPFFRPAEFFDPDGPGPATGSDTSYSQTSGVVADSQPRIASNLVVDASTENPAAAAAAAATPGSNSVDHDGNPATPEQFLIPNRAPDAALSAPFNSWFTLFGQFFDHGLDLVAKGGSGTVLVPLKPDDPLYVPGSHTNFMVLTRATNQKGPDGLLGTSDDVREHMNTTTPFVDQNQTYTSHPSHQVFLREYALDGSGKPVATGRLLDRPGVGGLPTWADVKAQARDLLGIELDDQDALNLPLLKTDDYGRFIPDPGTGFAQIVTDRDPLTFASGTPGAPVDATTAVRTSHAFLDDIAHHAVPFGDHDNNPATQRQPLNPDTTDGTNDDGDPATYDDELLNAHFITGDGRGNENIGLTAVHHIFHAEHNLRVEEIKQLIEEPGGPNPADWQLSPGVWNGERLFQAARFVTEMEYQHLVFEEFARKVQPQVNIFTGYQTEIDPAIVAEFAHTVYRFGHSMLTERVSRTNANGSDNSLGLIQAFLNPLAFNNDGSGPGTLSPEAAAGSVVRGMTRQVGNEIDEFVTGALRSNLLGLPLDLATINIARGRDTGVPGLNEARRRFHEATGSSVLQPYASWNDFKLGLRHPESLINFVAAYGRHASITGAATVAGKREAAGLIVNGGPGAPADREAFLDGPAADTGVNDVDFWIGGLAEKQLPFGGLLGSTFNFVFETQMEKLQDADRFYYLSRTAGLNFLTQLEQNSFAELVMRTTDTTHLPLDIFSRPDFMFEIANIGASGPPQDDPATPDWNEAQLLTRSANGTVRFGGAEHVVFGGTDAGNRITSSEGDDSLWGDGGGDRLDGGAGNDGIKGGAGDDILTDLFGDDNIDGGAGDDAINAGGGLDLILGGSGTDFVVGGQDPKEVFAGGEDDFVIAGDSEDIVFGGAGSDWIEGGAQADTVEGEHGNPFLEDRAPGHDVLVGDGGNEDLHAEGGDDIMVAGPGDDRNEGMFGFDWVTHRGDPEPANADMNFTEATPPMPAVRERFTLVEAMSGWDNHDVLRGDDADATVMAGHELTNPGLIAGLDGIIGGASSFTGGNILIGGGGSDLIEGRGGNDILDGDRWLDVRISVRDAADPSVELRNVASMRAIQADVLAGTIRPSQLRVVRDIKTPPAAAAGIDTAVFSEPRANYDLSTFSTEVMTVRHARGTQIDGTDTLRNIERLQFADQTIEIEPLATNTPATGTVNISDTTPAEDQELTASPAFADADGINSASIVYSWQTETAPGSWATIGTGPTFSPGDEAVASPLRVEATFQDNDGLTERVLSAPTSPVTNVNDVPSGRPVLGDTTPVEGQAVVAHTGSISDADGLTAVEWNYQWQEDAGGGFSDIGGATNVSFTPTGAQVGRPLRVRVTFTDDHGTTEQVFSLGSSPVTAAGAAPEPVAIPPAQQPADSPPAAQAPPASGGNPVPAPDRRRASARLRATSLAVTVRRGLITVGATVPAGARVVRIQVYRVSARARSSARGRRLATVYRSTRGAKRYRFRLTERRLRNLAAGRYRVEVSVGPNRAGLGPSVARPFRIR